MKVKVLVCQLVLLPKKVTWVLPAVIWASARPWAMVGALVSYLPALPFW